MRLLINNNNIEIRLGKVHEDEIDIDIGIIKYLLEEINREKKPCVEYTTVTGICYELCRDMLMPNKFTLNIYYKI